MANNIVYLLGAGASANAIPVMKKLPKGMEYFYKVVTGLLKEHNMLNGSFDKLNQLYEEILEEIEQFGTPDTLAKICMHKGEDLKLWHLKDLISCYMLFEQLNVSKTGFLDWGGSTSEKVRNEIFGEHSSDKDILIESKFDNRYIEFLSATLDGTKDKIQLSEKINIISWNYDHQIEKALGVFAKDDLKFIQERFKIFPITDVVDYALSAEDLAMPAFHAQIVKINGTAGFSNRDNSGISLFDVNKHVFDLESLKLIGKLLFRERQFEQQFSKLNFAWETDSEKVVAARQSAAEKFKSADAVVVIGYSFPNFNREVDRQIFKDFDIDKGTIYIQDLNPDVIIEKLDGVKEGLKDKAVAVRSGGSFTIPNEFWE